MNLNKVGNYNNKSFLGTNSAKPLTAVPLRVSGDLSQGKLTGADVVLPGDPVKVENQVFTGTNAGKGLNPNVLKVTKATTDADVSGFLLVNETDVLLPGSEAGRAFENQVVNVALLGSRVELYLPADDSVVNVNVNKKLKYDFATKTLKADDTGTITLLSPVVDGRSCELKGSDVVFKDCKVAKVRL